MWYWRKMQISWTGRVKNKKKITYGQGRKKRPTYIKREKG